MKIVTSFGTYQVSQPPADPKAQTAFKESLKPLGAGLAAKILKALGENSAELDLTKDPLAPDAAKLFKAAFGNPLPLPVATPAYGQMRQDADKPQGVAPLAKQGLKVVDLDSAPKPAPAPAPKAPVPVAAPVVAPAPSAMQRALDGVWLSQEESRCLQAILGPAGAEDLVHRILDIDNHPSGLRLAAKELAGIDRGAPYKGAEPLVFVASDSARAYTKMQRYVDGLMNQGKDTNVVLQAFVHDLFGKMPMKELTWVVERYAGGDLAPLKTLHAQLTQKPYGAPVDAALHAAHQAQGVWAQQPDEMLRPSQRAIDQAEEVRKAFGAQYPVLGVLARAEVGKSAVPDCVAPSSQERGHPDYLAIERQLGSPLFHELSPGQKRELADILWLSQQKKTPMTLVTQDWALLKALATFAKVPADRTGPFFKDRVKPLTFDVTVGKSQLHVTGVPALANTERPQETQMLKLATQMGPTFTYGAPVRVGNELGYVHGFDTHGNLRVYFPNDEMIRTLDGFERVVPLGKKGGAQHVETPATQAWKPIAIKSVDLVKRFPSAANLRALAKRLVPKTQATVAAYMKLVSERGFQSYIVGGATRDVLLGANPNDIDLASSLPSLDLYHAITAGPKHLGRPRDAADGDRKAAAEVRVKEPFGIVQVEPSDPAGLDVVTMHDGHVASTRLDLDALARDFTINAVYYDPTTDIVHDPIGTGLADLEEKRVRFVCDPGEALVEPCMVARWIKCMSKDGFHSDSHADEVAVRNALVKYAGEMDEPTRMRFMDRMTCSAAKAEERVKKIFPGDGEALAAIRSIYGQP